MVPLWYVGCAFAVSCAVGIVIIRRALAVYRRRDAVEWAEYCDLQDDWATYSAKVILGGLAVMMLLQLFTRPNLGAMACLAGMYIVIGIPIILVATNVAKGIVFPDPGDGGRRPE